MKLQSLATSINGLSTRRTYYQIPSTYQRCLYSTLLPRKTNHAVRSTTFDAVVPTGLARLSNAHLLRNIILGACFSIPFLQKPSLVVLRALANSRSVLLNPDKNALLRAIIKPILYKQFCAGTTRREIVNTQSENKRIGYSGTMLCSGKEVQPDSQETKSSEAQAARNLADIKHFRDCNIETLDLVGPGDWLGVKFTAAGCLVTRAAMTNSTPPPAFMQAMHEICERAAIRGVRVYIDAEQHVLLSSTERWTADLMRKYNKNDRAVVYTTIQAYLKASRQRLQQQIALAKKGNYTLGVKLVRGAYIAAESRGLIHDTKQDTDDCYDTIAQDLLFGTDLGLPQRDLPSIQLLLCGHNPYSVLRAWDLVQDLHSKNELRITPDFAMLQGMGDVVACKILQQVEDEQKAKEGPKLKMYKCLHWGSVRECMHYLFRRAIENQGSAERMKDGLRLYTQELRRRVRQGVGMAVRER